MFRRERVDLLDGDRLGTAELVDAAVVGDPIQPRSQRQPAIVGAKAVEGPHEYLLEGVLGILSGARQHLTRVGEQPRAIAIVDHPEGVVVALAKQRHELLVGADPKQGGADRDPTAPEAYRCWECGGFH